MSKKVSIEFSKQQLSEIERLKISMALDEYGEVIGKALQLLSVVDRERAKGFDEIFVGNIDTGVRKELVNFWKEQNG